MAEEIQIPELGQKEEQRLRELLQEAEKQKLIIESANDSIKGARKLAKDDCGIEGKIFNKLLENRTKHNLEQKQTEYSVVETLYDRLFPAKTTQENPGVSDA